MSSAAALRELSPEAMAAARDAVGTLVMALNTAVVYQTGHPVFKSILSSRLPLLQQALEKIGPLRLLVEKGELRIEAHRYENPTRAVNDFAHRLDELNVRGLTLEPGLTADDFIAFIRGLGEGHQEVQAQGLDAWMKAAGRGGVSEFKTRVKLDGAPDAPRTPQSPAAARAPAAAGTFELVLDDEPAETPEASAAANPAPDDTEEFRAAIGHVLGRVAQGGMPADAAAEAISSEFGRRLEDRIRDVRAESERQVGRLQTIKDIVLKQMDEYHIAALAVDSALVVLTANEQGRALIGAENQLPRDSALGRFARSGREKAIIEIGGRRREAQLLLMMDHVGRETVMLISLKDADA